jgi:hypothetical protein
VVQLRTQRRHQRLRCARRRSARPDVASGGDGGTSAAAPVHGGVPCALHTYHTQSNTARRSPHERRVFSKLAKPAHHHTLHAVQKKLKDSAERLTVQRSLSRRGSALSAAAIVVHRWLTGAREEAGALRGHRQQRSARRGCVHTQLGNVSARSTHTPSRMRAMHITHMHHTSARFLPAAAAGAVRQRSKALAQAPQSTPISWACWDCRRLAPPQLSLAGC